MLMEVVNYIILFFFAYVTVVFVMITLVNLDLYHPDLADSKARKFGQLLFYNWKIRLAFAWLIYLVFAVVFNLVR